MQNLNKDLNKKIINNQKKWMWIILFGFCLMQIISFSIVQVIPPTLMSISWLGWLDNKLPIAVLTFTIGALVGALIAPLISRLFSTRINLKLIYCLGIGLSSFGFFSFGFGALTNFGGTVAILYISNIIIQIGSMIFFGIGANHLISMWWPSKKRGMALGFVYSGSSIGNLCLIPFARWLIVDIFPNTQYIPYFIMGGLAFVVGIFICLIIVRKPINLGINEFDKSSSTKECVVCSKKVDSEVGVKAKLSISPMETKKFPWYWILFIGFLLEMMAVSFLSSMPQTLINKNFDHYGNIIVNYVMIYAACCLASNLIGGILNDKLGPRKSLIIGFTLQFASLVLMLLSLENNIIIYLTAACSGLSAFIYTSTPAFLCGKLFGIKNSGSHIGIISIFLAIGFAISSPIAALLIGDLTSNSIPGQIHGNWSLGIIYAMVCVILAFVLIISSILMIRKVGISGIQKYSNTKYANVIRGSLSLAIAISSFIIILKKEDFRNNNLKRDERIKRKQIKFDKKKDQLIDKEINRFDLLINRIECINKIKIQKINEKIDIIKNANINNQKLEKNKKKAEDLLIKYNKIEQKINTRKYSELKRYILNYKNEQNKLTAKNNVENQIRIKQNKIKKITNKQVKAELTEKLVYKCQKDNHCQLIDYYNNKYQHYDLLINQKIKDYFENKDVEYTTQSFGCQLRYDKLLEDRKKYLKI